MGEAEKNLLTIRRDRNPVIVYKTLQFILSIGIEYEYLSGSVCMQVVRVTFWILVMLRSWGFRDSESVVRCLAWGVVRYLS